MYIGQNIRFLRKSKKMSQTELAEQLGLNMASLSTYERERSEPTISTLAQIAEFFGISIDDLVFRDLTKKEEAESSQQKSMLSYAEDLEAGRKTVDEVEAEVGDQNMGKIVKLLELRVNELELAIKRENPDLAKELKIE